MSMTERNEVETALAPDALKVGGPGTASAGEASVHAPSAPKRRKPIRPATVARHVALVVGAIISSFPFYWMFILSTHPSKAIYQFPPKLLPGDRLDDNISTILSKVNIWGAMSNTAIVAVTTTVLSLLVASLAAFAFAKYKFPGRNALFLVVMATFLLPAQLATIPQFLFMSKIGWVGDFKALIFPSLASAFGVFWLRQYASNSIPDEMLEAARIDGCGFFRQYWHVCLPMIRPALAFLGMFSFIGSWNDFMWPLIVLTDPSRLTLQVALSQLKTAHGSDYGMLMASALIAVLPLILVFVLGAKQFIAGITDGAVKQ